MTPYEIVLYSNTRRSFGGAVSYFSTFFSTSFAFCDTTANSTTISHLEPSTAPTPPSTDNNGNHIIRNKNANIETNNFFQFASTFLQANKQMNTPSQPNRKGKVHVSPSSRRDGIFHHFSCWNENENMKGTRDFAIFLLLFFAVDATTSRLFRLFVFYSSSFVADGYGDSNRTDTNEWRTADTIYSRDKLSKSFNFLTDKMCV